MRIIVIFILTLFLTSPVWAEEDRLIKIDTRPGVTVSFYAMKRDGAVATIILLPGGAGGIGMKNGVPTSNNFLVRSRELFAAQGFNVAVVGKPSDTEDLDGSFRISPEHVEDLKQVVAYARKTMKVPVWVVGTSMGTISATALAIATGSDEVAGIVLTSSVTNKKSGAVPGQKLNAIKVPVLVVHHEFDECKICVPGEVSWIVDGLKNAPIKKEVYLRGGTDPKGNPCEALHRHGFVGMENEVVELIAAWLKHPAP
jgi:pimeloyl-ACP methyl ester carboxylesterase